MGGEGVDGAYLIFPCPLLSEPTPLRPCPPSSFRGRAFGNNPNWADVKNQKAHDAFSKPNGKVLLYTSRDKDANPSMMMTHETVAQLPPILQKLSGKFSPIRSK